MQTENERKMKANFSYIKINYYPVDLKLIIGRQDFPKMTIAVFIALVVVCFRFQILFVAYKR